MQVTGKHGMVKGVLFLRAGLSTVLKAVAQNDLILVVPLSEEKCGRRDK